MPASNPQHIPVVLHFALSIRPMSVLDVGIGNGTYGFLLRQYLDIGAERIAKNEWILRIDGVEIFEKYRNPVWEYAYDNVYIADARDYVKESEYYDIILFNDVLEHVARSDARQLVSAALKKARLVIATTPRIHYPQGSWGGNEAEAHQCQLDASDFESLVVMKKTGDTACYVCSSDVDAARSAISASVSCPEWKVGLLPYIAARFKRKVFNIKNVGLGD